MTVGLIVVAFLAGTIWQHASREIKVGKTLYTESNAKASEGRRRMTKYGWYELFAFALLLGAMILAVKP